ncbi:H(+)/Cl(-) exchange transporter ClcA [soil metagenome]
MMNASFPIGQRQVRQLAATAVIGISVGLVAVGFHYTMVWVSLWLVERPSHGGWSVFVPTVLAGMVGCAFFTGLLMKHFAPDAPGSGIPQVKVAYHRNTLDFSWKLIWVKFVGGALSIGSGSSLGREGPTIHIGAALASKIASFAKVDDEAKANAICAGSAAGLAAAFSSPLAGVTLVLEEIAGGRNQNKFAGRALLAAAMAASVVYALSRGAACLPIGPDLPISWKVLWLTPIIALAAGGAGIFFQWSTLKTRHFFKSSRMGVPMRVSVGALAGALTALAAYGVTGHTGVFGLGEADLLEALNNRIVWTTAICLLVGKLIATTACYGSGGCGGIFAPIIFFGGMVGVAVHGALAPWFGLTMTDQTLIALVGMTACLAAVVRAPLTSILIVVEMTWQIHILPSLMMAAVIGVFMNRFCFAGNFYDAALAQDGIKLGEDE